MYRLEEIARGVALVIVATRPLAVARDGVPDGIVAIPVRTALVRAGDDLAAHRRGGSDGHRATRRRVAISETARRDRAGRFVAAETCARRRSRTRSARRAGALATVNQPESLQLVIDQVGHARVLYAALAHVFGRAFGRRGVFYEVMGESDRRDRRVYRNAAALRARDRPCAARAGRVRAVRIRAAPAALAIVDANDLEKAKVLGASAGVDAALVERALLDNPHGNGDEQTPLVVLKWRGRGRNPLVEAPHRERARHFRASPFWVVFGAVIASLPER